MTFFAIQKLLNRGVFKFPLDYSLALRTTGSLHIVSTMPYFKGGQLSLFVHQAASATARRRRRRGIGALTATVAATVAAWRWRRGRRRLGDGGGDARA